MLIDVTAYCAECWHVLHLALFGAPGLDSGCAGPLDVAGLGGGVRIPPEGGHATMYYDMIYCAVA